MKRSIRNGDPAPEASARTPSANNPTCASTARIEAEDLAHRSLWKRPDGARRQSQSRRREVHGLVQRAGFLQDQLERNPLVLPAGACEYSSHDK